MNSSFSTPAERPIAIVARHKIQNLFLAMLTEVHVSTCVPFKKNLEFSIPSQKGTIRFGLDVYKKTLKSINMHDKKRIQEAMP